MSRGQRVLIVIALLLLAANWLYPPWIHYAPTVHSEWMVTKRYGYFFVLDTQQGEADLIQLRLDFGRAIAQSLVLLTISGAMFVALKRKSLG